MVFVSSPKHINEIDKTSDAVLSLNGAAKHVRKPFVSMYLRALIVITDISILKPDATASLYDERFQLVRQAWR